MSEPGRDSTGDMSGSSAATAAAAESAPAVPPPASGAGDGESARASDALIRAALSEVYDPEIGIDIVSLGLVYDTRLNPDGLLEIDMTLTTPYCPLGPVIQTQAHAVCAPLPGVRDVRVNLVWSPPWDPRTMASEEARLELGIY